jgi:energy-coupling factor transport system substrate-specific component
VGRRLIVALLAALALAAVASASPASDAARYLESRQHAEGGFGEPGRAPTPGLTAWALIGLRAAGRPPAALEPARAYLERAEAELVTATDVEVALIAHGALGHPAPELVRRLRAMERGGGLIGSTLNATIWGVIALRAVGENVRPATVRTLLRAQRSSGGWGWSQRAAADSNDTAAAIQALRVVGVRGKPIARGLAFLARHRNRDGGFELAPGRGSDAQSTAWAIQAYRAAGRRPPASAVTYLRRLQRADGSVRYSARYAVTPVWVTAQALAALAGRPLPLRRATAPSRTSSAPSRAGSPAGG